MSSLYLTGIAPSATAALSNAQNAFMTSGARASMVLSFFRFSLLYIWFYCLVGLSKFRRNDLERFGKVLMCCRIHGTMFFDFARRMCPKIVAAFPIFLWTDRSRGKTSAAIWTDVSQNLLDAGSAEGAFKAANHRFR